jgi:hypothetical protein
MGHPARSLPAIRDTQMCAGTVRAVACSCAGRDVWWKLTAQGGLQFMPWGNVAQAHGA